MSVEADLAVIDEMARSIRNVGPGVRLELVSDRLIDLRDDLQFADGDWYDDLTQHVVTIDSASSFEPGNASERLIVEKAVREALSEIRTLLDRKRCELEDGPRKDA